ncbi:hypothetical protein F1D05_31770 [Kribbella qitaiheensis]|uniref:Uncharacterized protein n=1 Tax=Kribbella qitaiheensis TaxID=1544730 RepID=A0A7G6X5Z8_9ACTN|nr:hypothetical protein [Kribbella qitaiheensis]QNE21663.1 hypothetical protein F1D05_31770 [Kribbella qitaiheensis]
MTLLNAAVVVAIVIAVLARRLSWLGHLLGATITSGGGSILLTVGANLLVQSLVVQAKAHRDAEEYATR